MNFYDYNSYICCLWDIVSGLIHTWRLISYLHAESDGFFTTTTSISFWGFLPKIILVQNSLQRSCGWQAWWEPSPLSAPSSLLKFSSYIGVLWACLALGHLVRMFSIHMKFPWWFPKFFSGLKGLQRIHTNLYSLLISKAIGSALILFIKLPFKFIG